MSDDFLYSLKTSRTQSRIKELLDQAHGEGVQLTLPMFIPNQVLGSVDLDPSCAKEIYRADQDQVFRWDQTRALIQVTRLGSLTATRAYGPVFRRGPRGKYRWRQFYQYDADYDYQIYGLNPILNLARFFRSLGRGFQFRFNHLDRSNPLAQVGPGPQGVDYIWDPSLVRDHTYYRGVVFQVYHQGTNVALAGGGVYMGHRLMMGYGVGVTRLAKLVDQGYLDLPLHPLVGIYVHQGYPSRLMGQLRALGLTPYLFHRHKNLRKDSHQVETRLKPLGYGLKLILIHGANQEATGIYQHRFPGQGPQSYQPSLLGLRVKQWIDLGRS